MPKDRTEDFVYDYYEGLQIAAETKKPILLIFTGRKCENPSRVNQLLEEDKQINQLIRKQFVPVILFVDDKSRLPKVKIVEHDGEQKRLTTKGSEWAHVELSKYKSNVQPFLTIIDSNEDILKPPISGKISKAELISYIQFRD